ncbi:MAG: ribonucleoside-diphosphate reductase, adenosylcobalamin-dependent [Planctomycetes bacterium TMED75]|nr:ribonucleoside-diphosphate reductase, adenosylcobalamin-dependent [Planctomycetaceae bacterium]OUU92230.1 MAG: ribonucleoside-diphosphate reductase, adenosylcobalamin-dependent [Planctomycetes bacterium TMED75]
MKFTRRFTKKGESVFDNVEWTHRTSKITNADGSLVFEMDDAEIPADWSQLATDIVVSKYFRKAGVPQMDANGTPILDQQGNPTTGPEKSVKQIIHRLAGCWREWGLKHDYFASEDDADAFYDELSYMLVNQMAAPNSPQWFNTGLEWAYGINGPAQGHWIADHTTGALSAAPDAYTHPQPHACFIQSVRDDLVGEGGIMDLWVREARLFKYGSGTGTNFSQIRGENEPLSGGGMSSGLMSFLKIGDRAAGAIKSGGTTRRAAKMVCLDIDHPDVEGFVNWKVREEIKVAALVEGMKHLDQDQKEVAQSLGLELDYDFNGEAYYTVSGQNSNNSVRLTDEFFKAVEDDAEWTLTQRTDGAPAKTMPARKLWDQISFAAWRCADPGVQFDSTINAWHTCPEGGRINASNPCSEYMFLDNTACNLASINLLKFYDSTTRNFDIEGFEHAVGIWTIVLEISVLMAAFPSKEIADRSWRYRTLGLGYANLGAMLMQAGIPYDSEEGRAICGTISAMLTGRSYAASALLAAEHGPFGGYEDNREHMLKVIRNHRRAAHGVARDSEEWEQLTIRPVPIDHTPFENESIGINNAQEMLDRCMLAWDDALRFGEKFGYRNAQVTVIAPTGTIGLLMDCDTTGVEPDFALTKFKKLAGGGYFKIANQSLRPALSALGYETAQTDEIITWVMGSLDLDVPMPAADGTMGADEGTLREFLLNGAGYEGEELVALENQLPTVFELSFAFNAWTMPERVMKNVGVDVEAAKADPGFNGLRALGLTTAQIKVLNRLVCGTQTVEGAPHLSDRHLPVFDCANRCGPTGQRYIAPNGHIRMMAAAQPFISGAISKTINLPNEASINEIGDAYTLSWSLGLKANALYRDGCKLSQPLSTTSEIDEDADEDTDQETVVAGTAETPEPTYIERIVEKIIERPMRRRLPDTRESLTHKFNVAGHEGYLIVGLYEDGTPGELFITMAKEGSTIGGLMDSLGTAISVALQYGVPVQSLVNKFAHQRFEPMGITTNNDIPFAKSLVDYIFRWFGIQFISGYREQNSPNRETKGTKDKAPETVMEDTRWKQDASQRTSSSPLDDQGTGKTESKSSPATHGDMTGMSSGPGAENTSDQVVDPESRPGGTVLDQLNANLMGDAPACDVCGSITVRNGTCYKCNNCGNSMGCS